MQENNRHILIDGINKLPEHKAPEGLWNNIETMMFTVPANVLPVHEPATATWSAIEAGISQSRFFRKTTYRSLAIALLILLFGGAATIYFNGNYFNNPIPTKISNIGIVTTNESENSNQEVTIIDNEESIAVSESITNNIPDDPEVSIVATQEEQIEVESTVTTNNNIIKSQFNRDNIGIKPINPYSIVSLRSQSELLAYELRLSNLEQVVNDIGASKKDPFQDCNFHRPEQNFYIGPGLEYHHFLNSIEPQDTKLKYWYSADLRVMYQRNRFFIETGLGISFSKDKIGFTYDYLTNELVNTYEYVDSVYYDPITGTTEYYTTTVEVYDSIAYSTQSASETSYTYLQIPLEIGYEVWKVNKFSMSIKAGVTYFKQLTAKEIQPNLFHENSRITSINTSSISRNKELFRVSGGVGLRWDINRKVNLLLNPSFNYFLVDIYNNLDNENKPIGMGIRFGLYYKF